MTLTSTSLDVGTVAAAGGRSEDLRELLFDLYDEFGRALETGDLDWCAVLDGLLIPRVEAEVLAAGGGAPRRA